MNTKHTPGPWIADLETWAGIVNAPAGTIAGPVGGSKGATLDELHANARLIAAAPELLEALDGLMAKLSAKSPALQYHDCKEAYEQARTAIAKATGYTN